MSSIDIPDFFELAWRHSDWNWDNSYADALFPGALLKTLIEQSERPQIISFCSSIINVQTEAGTDITWSHFPLSHARIVLSSEPEKYFPGPAAFAVNTNAEWPLFTSSGYKSRVHTFID